MKSNFFRKLITFRQLPDMPLMGFRTRDPIVQGKYYNHQVIELRSYIPIKDYVQTGW